MSGLNLRLILNTKIRTLLYGYLSNGPLADWSSSDVLKIANQFVEESQYQVDDYVRNHASEKRYFKSACITIIFLENVIKVASWTIS